MDVVVRSSTIATAGVCRGGGVDVPRARSTVAGGGAAAPRVAAAAAATPSQGRWRRVVHRLRVEGMTNRSLFVFSEHNFVRKYAKIIIEWGYPLCTAGVQLRYT